MNTRSFTTTTQTQVSDAQCRIGCRAYGGVMFMIAAVALIIVTVALVGGRP